MSRFEKLEKERAVRREEILKRVSKESDLVYLDHFEAALSRYWENEQNQPRQAGSGGPVKVEDLQYVLSMGMRSGNEGTGLTYKEEKRRAQLTVMQMAFMIALRIPRTNELTWVKQAVTKYYAYLTRYPDTTGRLTRGDEKKVADMWELTLPPRPSYKRT